MKWQLEVWASSCKWIFFRSLYIIITILWALKSDTESSANLNSRIQIDVRRCRSIVFCAFDNEGSFHCKGIDSHHLFPRRRIHTQGREVWKILPISIPFDHIFCFWEICLIPCSRTKIVFNWNEIFLNFTSLITIIDIWTTIGQFPRRPYGRLLILIFLKIAMSIFYVKTIR